MPKTKERVVASGTAPTSRRALYHRMEVQADQQFAHPGALVQYLLGTCPGDAGGDGETTFGTCGACPHDGCDEGRLRRAMAARFVQLGCPACKARKDDPEVGPGEHCPTCGTRIDVDPDDPGPSQPGGPGNIIGIRLIPGGKAS